MNASNILKYLGYALGEIVLLVVGINVAIYFDNQNEQKQNDEYVHKIHALIAQELEQDTTNLGMVIEYYNNKLPTFKKVLSGTLTSIKTDSLPFYENLITTYAPLTFTEKGFKLLSNNAAFQDNFNDSLNINLSNYYALVKNDIEGRNIQLIENDIFENLGHFKMNYSWFKNLGQSPEFIEYTLTSGEYQNLVFQHAQLVYGNLMPKLSLAKSSATELLVDLEKANR